MKKEKICGIYKITSPSGRVYIGQGINIEKRVRTYKNLHCKTQPRLYASLLKYGVEEHTFEIIENCLEEDLDCRERFWQDMFDVIGKNGLNCVLTACEEENLIGEISEDKRERLSISHLNIKPSEKSTNMFIEMITKRVKSEEERLNISLRMSKENHHFWKKSLSVEHKSRIGASNKGKNKGKICSDGHRKNLSISHKGLYADEKHPMARLILCTETGIFYYTLKSAAIAYNIKNTSLCAMLRGQNPNKTSLIYC